MSFLYKTVSLAFFSILFVGIFAFSQENIKVDFSEVIKQNVNPGFGSANLCWLTDSDKNRPNTVQSMESAIKELGTGSLRFPYGHLADNYLWHSPPYYDVKNGLRPKVAAPSQAPFGWDWAVNEDGSFKSSMDFDEFMQLCKKLDIKPLVVINVFSFKYKGGPSYEELKTAAVEWVKYAKKKNYKVAYWQIGNEIDHHKDLLSMDAYVNLYQDFAKAMKEEDATIKVGPGILSSVDYYNTIVQKYPDLIDFTSCHQYAWKYIKSCSNYEEWKNHVNLYTPNVLPMQEAVSNSTKPNMDIVITENGVTPVGKGMGDFSNTYKALWFFEMLMNEASLPNVAYSYFWGTHSPWSGLKDSDRDLGLLFRLDDNSRKPIADGIKLVNDHILDHLVATKQTSGYIRTYASKNKASDKYNIFLMNRNDKAEKVTLQLDKLPKKTKTFKRTEFKGKFPESRKVQITKQKVVAVENNSIDIILPPLSITVLQN
ncbi:hypothetical protein [Galbibacter mesophilus]|uniref:hypothetical protein n=1 Tax=Galbibacter mesophilus TaxID=379069 RepID=UPI00191E7D2E|nr:hypothetical protein [Galbibacter mesophilus]MCM5664039.1 hypothetical protein [Galbibacter mesophilus]